MTTQTKTTWRKVKLGEVTDIKMGQSPDSKFYNYQKKGIPFYQGVTDYGEKYPKNSVYCSNPIKIANAGDIFFSVRAPVGDVNIAVEKSCIGRGVASLKMKNGNNYFLYFLLKNYSKYFKGVAGGTTYESINKDQIEDMEFFIPTDIAEQKRIAAILSAFDDKIELNNKINQTLEQIAQAIFKEWFVKFRFPGYEKTELVDTELGKIPKEWEVKKLNQLVKPQYGYTASASDNKIGSKFLRVKDINKAGWIQWNDVPYCKISSEEFLKYKLAFRDIVIARMADPGKVAIVEQKVEAVFGSYLIRLKIIDKFIIPYFLYYYLISPPYQGFVLGSSTGTTRQSINAKLMTDCLLVLPPKEILLRFENIISKLRSIIIKNLKENQTLASLRDLLLPKLMSGDIRV